MRKFHLGTLAACAAAVTLGAASVSSAAVVFSDDFESGNLNNWTSTAATASPFTISNTRNVVPAAGSFSAAQDTSVDRMHHNIIADNGGSELSGAFSFTTYIYDPVLGGSTSTRMFNEIRGYTAGTGLPNGGTTASGSLAQLLAIGKYNATDVGGTFNANKYQARVVFGPAGTTGWFNLDGTGSPNRSVGWHSFTISREADGTTLNFFVDGIFSKSYANATAQSMDTIVIGGGLGTTSTDSNVDGISLSDVATIVPEPMSLSALGAAGLVLGRRRRA